MNISTFLFGPYPLQMQTADLVFFYLSLASLVVALVLIGFLFFSKLNPVVRKLLQRLRNLTMTFGLIGLLLSAFRYESAPYLSYRLWFILLIVGIGVWKIKLLWFLLTRFKKDLRGWQALQVKERYFKR